MAENASRRQHVVRLSLAVVLGLLWIGLGLGVGWAVGFMADRLVLPERHGVVVATLALCGVVLVGWAYTSRLLYLEVCAGVAEERSEGTPPRRRTEYRYVALLAAPIIAAIIGLSSANVSVGTHGAPSRPAATAAAPAHAVQSLDPHNGSRPEAARSEHDAGTYTVRPGDRLTTLAEHFYGTSADWSVIAKANLGRLDEKSGERLVDPTMLPIGLQLVIPSTNVVATTPPPTASSHHTGPSRDLALFSMLAGFGLLGASLFARRQRRQRAYQPMSAPLAGRPPRLSTADATLEAQLHPLAATGLPDWIDAANRLLGKGLVADSSLVPPRVSVMRAGPLGIEVLLDDASLVAPPGFVVLDAGRTWRLDPALELEAVREMAGAAYPYLAGLIPIAEDDTGSYLVAVGPGEALSVQGTPDEIARGIAGIVSHLKSAPWGEVAFYRVGKLSLVDHDVAQELSVASVAGLDAAVQREPLWRAGLPEDQPIVLVEDPDLAEEVRAAAPGIVVVIGTLCEADRTLFFEGDSVTIEPLGLTLPACLPSLVELESVARLRAAASAKPTSAVKGRDALPFFDTELPVAGEIEVRILRSMPDLVGDVRAVAGPNVVQLVAYLALHEGHADTSTLRDAFAMHLPDTSWKAQSIWNATAATRKALGEQRFPPARGNQPYSISNAVTCDWLRLKEIASIAKALEAAGEATRAIKAFAIALGLIDGVPCGHDAVAGRYVWLDAEQHLVEIESVVVEAASSMATLCIEHHPYENSLDDAAWAIRQGRIISPDALPLRQAAMFLADARGDSEAVTGEYEAAVDAVYGLEIREDVDPEIERIQSALHRSPTDPWSVRDALA